MKELDLRVIVGGKLPVGRGTQIGLDTLADHLGGQLAFGLACHIHPVDTRGETELLIIIVVVHVL